MHVSHYRMMVQICFSSNVFIVTPEMNYNTGCSLKAIPLKLFYYQTFFETWGNEHSWYEHAKMQKYAIQKYNKRMVSPCKFTRQQALKMGYFYWLRVKNLNHLHKELNLGYLKGTKVYLESKVSFIDISSIALFKPFLIAWLREYCTFWTVPWLTWGPCLGQNTPSWKLFWKKKKIVFYYQTFFPLQICSSLDCS